MKRLLFFLSFLTLAVTAFAQENTAPKISLDKKLFRKGETVTLNYLGTPQPLTITLENTIGQSVGYKATVSALQEKDSNNEVLRILPYSPWKTGTYSIAITQGTTQLLRDTFVIDEPSPSITRMSSKIIEPNKTTTVTLNIPDITTKTATSSMTLVESAPIDAVINDPNIQQIRKPELLNLRFPFNEDYELTLGFGQVDPDEHLGMPNHDGIDFATTSGTPIVAVDEGEIVPYREENNYGTTVAVQHLWGQSFYGHLSTSSAQLGEKVKKGQIIGFSGSTGRSTGPHLHLGIKWNDSRMIDPLPLLSASNNNKVAEKQLIFTIPLSTSQISYDMVLVRPEPVIQSIELSPSYIYVATPKPLFTERDSHIILLNGEKDAGDKLIQDPHLTVNTLITSQDGVIIWKNDDQDMLKVYDTVTKTFFEQPLFTDLPNSLSIDSKEYRVLTSSGTLALNPVIQ